MGFGQQHVKRRGASFLETSGTITILQGGQPSAVFGPYYHEHNPLMRVDIPKVDC